MCGDVVKNSIEGGEIMVIDCWCVCVCLLEHVSRIGLLFCVFVWLCLCVLVCLFSSWCLCLSFSVPSRLCLCFVLFFECDDEQWDGECCWMVCCGVGGSSVVWSAICFAPCRRLRGC